MIIIRYTLYSRSLNPDRVVECQNPPPARKTISRPPTISMTCPHPQPPPCFLFPLWAFRTKSRLVPWESNAHLDPPVDEFHRRRPPRDNAVRARGASEVSISRTVVRENTLEAARSPGSESENGHFGAVKTRAVRALRVQPSQRVQQVLRPSPKEILATGSAIYKGPNGEVERRGDNRG
ncbi:hypothetical protein JHW43_005731 [Diplocarpon mali]|nr:hypothetical protein JHW43_005731 [Diplocarpon mali]